MLNFLLNMVGTDAVPEVVVGIDFDTDAFIFGIVIGIFIAFSLIGIVKYVKFIIKDNKEMKEKLNSKESE